jgi:hypothetical protein
MSTQSLLDRGTFQPTLIYEQCINLLCDEHYLDSTGLLEAHDMSWPRLPGAGPHIFSSVLYVEVLAGSLRTPV